RRFAVDRVVAHRWTEPFARERDRRVAASLSTNLSTHCAVPFDLFEGETLLPPGSLRSGSGGPYAVFTPFARAHRAEYSGTAPLPAPSRLPPLPSDIEPNETSLPSLAELGLNENPALQRGGEKRARERLSRFVDERLASYADERDRLDHDGTSRLSADLKFGTLSVRTVWHRVASQPPSAGRAKFLDELLWREFAHSTLWDRPELLERPFRAAFEGFPWRDDEVAWRAWSEGRTGYPVVDAAARQLLAEGFVHNRARMIAASFLTKHLLIHYRRGEAHYLEFLTDGDWAQNDMGWQWSAGCGVDAQPYFRVFHPVTQGQKFDPEGVYVRRWVPELTRLPTRYIHAPWTAPAAVLEGAGVRLGHDYPEPIVDHAEARAEFLATAARHLRGQGVPEQD
ncbi:MAG TPA: deoxyribodipyrimidine photo-lyase, partial [Polyangiaceae bacterium]|nr:deoxyribodipyrimidine photo-lyase [Polyangiaceae bacterium]